MVSDIPEEAANIFIKNIDKFETHGLLLVERKTMKVIYSNSAAERFFTPVKITSGVFLSEVFEEEQFQRIFDTQNGGLIEIENKKTLKIFSIQTEEYVIINVENYTQFINQTEENNYLLLLNQQLRETYELCGYDTLSITDGKGVIEFCGESCLRQCGISAKDTIGNTMYALEAEGYFTPAATIKVIETHKPVAVLQKTKVGVKLCTIGIPVFDDDGKLYKVIAISKDYDRELDIALGMIGAPTENEIEEEKLLLSTVTILTCSEIIYKLMMQMERVAKRNVTVLISGETGTGKTLFASYIHNKSKRAGKPFTIINCGAIPENLIESELYGYEQGAFTGADKNGKAGLLEMAQGGTVLFDEIGELPLSQQVKLLHVLQEKTVTRIGGRQSIKLNIRVIAATNKNLQKMVEEGTFREDLYYRLNVIEFTIPSLSERREDIFLLANHFIQRYNQENNEYKGISKRAIQCLKNYDWPGNIRELENLIEMLCVIVPEETIDVNDLPSKIYNGERLDERKDEAVLIKEIMPMKDAIRELEKQLIKLAMDECGGNQYEIAAKLGVDRSTITRKINIYDLKNE